jgi:hypothetical protein
MPNPTEGESPPDDERSRLDALIKEASGFYHQSNAFERERDHALYLMCYHTVECLLYINTDAFYDLCQEREAKGDHPETRLIDLIARDENGKSVNDDKRADYAATVSWLGIHPELDDPDKAIDEIRKLGGITQVSEHWRAWATANLPAGRFGVRSESTRKATATRAKNAAAKTGRDTRTAPPAPPPQSAYADINAEGAPVEPSPVGPQASPTPPPSAPPTEGLRPAPNDSAFSFEPIMSEVGVTPKTIDRLTRERLFKFTTTIFHPRTPIPDIIASLRAYHRIAYGYGLNELAGIKQEYVEQFITNADVLYKGYKQQAEAAEAECEKLRAENEKLDDLVRELRRRISELEKRRR